MDIKKMIGARIQEIRNNKGITQERLSEMIGINPNYLSSIERGKKNPTLNTILKLADSLSVGLDELFRDIEIENPRNRRDMIDSLLDKADDVQLKLVYRILSVLIDKP